MIPQTVFGQCLATFVMLSGYGIIACPLVLSNSAGEHSNMIDTPCPRCYRRNHSADANFCRICGTSLRFSKRQHMKLGRLKHRESSTGSASSSAVSSPRHRRLVPKKRLKGKPQRRALSPNDTSASFSPSPSFSPGKLDDIPL